MGRLRCYRDPQRGAICALVATGAGLRDVQEVLVRHVSPDGSHVQIAGADDEIEPGAQSYVRATRLARLAEGALPDDPLLVNAADEAITDRAISDVVSDARRHTGLLLTSIRVRRAGTAGARDADDSAALLRRYGTSLHRLGEPLRGSTSTNIERRGPASGPLPSSSPAPHPAALNSDLIRQRRLDAGLSRRALATLVGGTARIIAGLEAGENHSQQEW